MYLESDYHFGTDGNAHSIQVAGWSNPEPGFTWSIGHSAHLLLPPGDASRHALIELTCAAFTHPGVLDKQRVRIHVNGKLAGSGELSRPTILSVAIPRRYLHRDQPVRISIECPDAARPCELASSAETRCLGLSLRRLRFGTLPPALTAMIDSRPTITSVAVPALQAPHSTASISDGVANAARTLTGKDPADLALEFVSLGQNCEFGLFQRACGAEPLSLLRFASIFTNHLVRGLQNGFEGLGTTPALEIALHGDVGPREFVVRDSAYEIAYHTFILEGQDSLEKVAAQEHKRLAFYKRKFEDDLEAGNRIFVRTMVPPHSCGLEMLSVWRALNARRPNTLLWIEPTRPGHPPGGVEQLAPGLLRGYIGAFAPATNAKSLHADHWLAVCAAAYRAQIGDIDPAAP